jgi:chloramphenicol-sensitive protein RarD
LISLRLKGSTFGVAQQSPNIDSKSGLVAGLAAYGLWGVMPLYFWALEGVPPGEILAQRIIWCGLLLALVTTLIGRWHEFAAGLRSPRVWRTFILTAVLLSINWLTYIYGVLNKQTVETSLGYFINPLLNVVFGVVIFRERLRPLQAVAVALAALGVLILVVAADRPPWIALTLAFSFALYGVFRKTAPADALLGLTFETLMLFLPAAGYAIYLTSTSQLHFGPNPRLDGLLAASGAVTAVPLLCFGVAARSLRLSTLGFLQFTAPTIQFLLAVTVMGELVGRERWFSFALIWVALGVYSIDIRRSLAGDAEGAHEKPAKEPSPVCAND